MKVGDLVTYRRSDVEAEDLQDYQGKPHSGFYPVVGLVLKVWSHLEEHERGANWRVLINVMWQGQTTFSIHDNYELEVVNEGR